MGKLINESVELSKNVEKSIRVVKEGIVEPVSSNIIFRVKTFQLSLVSQDYLCVYREHISFVDGYEEKLKNILKREAQICKLICNINLYYNKWNLHSISFKYPLTYHMKRPKHF